MKFLCIGYFNPAKMDALPPGEADALMQQCPAHMDTLYKTGKVVVVAGADPGATYLKRVDGKIEVSGGEDKTRVQIGCVFILEAADMEEAVRLASLHPTTQVPGGDGLGWYTEIRPSEYFYADKSHLPDAAGAP